MWFEEKVRVFDFFNKKEALKFLKNHTLCSLCIMILLIDILSNGIIFSGTISRDYTSNLLHIGEHWNPIYLISTSLAFVLNLIFLNLINHFRKKPIYNETFQKKVAITKDSIIQTLLGSLFYGLGWGIGNVSPSSLFMNLQFCTPHLIFFFFGFFVFGQIMGFYIDHGIKKCFWTKKPLDEKPIESPNLARVQNKIASQANSKQTSNEVIFLSESRNFELSTKYVSDQDDVELSEKVIPVVAEG